MKTVRARSTEQVRQRTIFEAVRKTLLQAPFGDRLDKPLAYWAHPNDRRLPLAFLGRTLNELLATPFDELRSTPGVGQKKIAALVTLLERATQAKEGNGFSGGAEGGQ